MVHRLLVLALNLDLLCDGTNEHRFEFILLSLSGLNHLIRRPTFRYFLINQHDIYFLADQQSVLHFEVALVFR
jgi:hypothetical protein